MCPDGCANRSCASSQSRVARAWHMTWQPTMSESGGPRVSATLATRERRLVFRNSPPRRAPTMPALDTTKDLSALFLLQAQATPDAVALEDDATSWTYADL